MPKIEFTNLELIYLKDIIFENRIDGHSYYNKGLKKLTAEKKEDKKALLCELESNVFNKIMSTETKGFKG